MPTTAHQNALPCRRFDIPRIPVTATRKRPTVPGTRPIATGAPTAFPGAVPFAPGALPKPPQPFTEALVLKDAHRMIREALYEDADNLLTAALCRGLCSVDIWMAAGLARYHRGAWRAAHAAFLMVAWRGGDPMAQEVADALERQHRFQRKMAPMPQPDSFKNADRRTSSCSASNASSLLPNNASAATFCPC
ncbi:MAG: hypothetical protein GX146_03905 [Myxococcales bacterium]|nr:hypothetical protein [Myxococcales bacterium]